MFRQMGVLGCLCFLRWYGVLPAIPRGAREPAARAYTLLEVCRVSPAAPLPAQIVPGSGAAHMPSNLQGTFNYMSPEAFDPELFGGVTFKTDVWSVPPLGESTLRGDRLARC